MFSTFRILAFENFTEGRIIFGYVQAPKDSKDSKYGFMVMHQAPPAEPCTLAYICSEQFY